MPKNPIEKLKAIAAKRNKTHWTHKEFLQFVSKEDREFFIASCHCFDELLHLAEVISNSPCRHHADQHVCETCAALVALYTKIKTELGE